jgi:CheY-like chemotaxis protein
MGNRSPAFFRNTMKNNILIIDNDQLLNKINEKVLRAANIAEEVFVTQNGQEAIELLRKRSIRNLRMPDMIILDLHLPVMNGFDFLDEFHKTGFAEKNKIELIVFTSSSNPNDRKKAFEKGVKHYLSKPYLLRNLAQIIHTTATAPMLVRNGNEKRDVWARKELN